MARRPGFDTGLQTPVRSKVGQRVKEDRCEVLELAQPLGVVIEVARPLRRRRVMHRPCGEGRDDLETGIRERAVLKMPEIHV